MSEMDKQIKFVIMNSRIDKIHEKCLILSAFEIALVSTSTAISRFKSHRTENFHSFSIE